MQVGGNAQCTAEGRSPAAGQPRREWENLTETASERRRAPGFSARPRKRAL